MTSRDDLIRTPRKRLSRRVLLGGIGALGAAAGLARLPVAVLAADPAPELGEGTLTTDPADAVVPPGGTLTLIGEGFGARPADGYLAFIIDDHAVQTDAGEDIHLQIPADAIDTVGNFSATLTVPTKIDEGRHWVRALGGLDGGDPVSKYVYFTVEAGTENDSATPVGSDTDSVTVTATAGATGAISLRLSGANLEPGAVVTATFADAPVELSARGSEPPLTVDETGTVQARGTLPAGAAIAGDYTLTVTVTGASSTVAVESPFTITPYIGFSSTSQDSDTTITVAALPAGASISSISAGDLTFTTQPVTAGDDGILIVDTTIPADAQIGEREVAVMQLAPAVVTYTSTVNITPSNKLFGTEHFVARSAVLDLPAGQLYQSVYSAKSNAVFVTSAAGEGGGPSMLFKLDADSLELLAQGDAATGPDGNVWPAFGIGIDDAGETVWVTNTRQNTVAVYQQRDCSLAQQLDEGQINHSRDVVIDEALGKAFVSGVTDSTIGVFSTEAPYPKLGEIDLTGGDADMSFRPISLDLDPATHTVYTVSIDAGKVAIINGDDLSFTVLTYEGSESGSGIAYAADTDRLFVASQGTSNVLVLDSASGDVIADTPTGGGALNAAWDPVHKLAYITNRSAGTVTVVDEMGNAIANLDGGKNPNHVAEDGNGSVFVVHATEGGAAMVTKLTYQGD